MMILKDNVNVQEYRMISLFIEIYLDIYAMQSL